MSYLIVGLEGERVLPHERAWLDHPAVGGAIVFARNWQSPEQMVQLTGEIREHCQNALIMVDQEGGRVQRMGAPLSVLPPLRTLGQTFDADHEDGLQCARAHGHLMAAEVLSLGLDLSLAPVLDLDAGSTVVGDRGLHRNPQAVAELATAYRQGMRDAGMAACGKHFPGHGTVVPDTHIDEARDDRSLEALMNQDLAPFVDAIDNGLEALMLAHVCYPKICPQPAGYSSRWVNDILRAQLGFDGVVISDDLGMRAAQGAGNFSQRVQASLSAGCDLLLVCRPGDVADVMTAKLPDPSVNRRRVDVLRGAIDAAPWTLFEGSQLRCELRSQIQCLN